MNSTIFRDVLFLALMAFVSMVVVMVPFVNPPAVNQGELPPGNVIMHITWPPGDTDVDMWVTGPGEIRPIGYSNKGGLLFNLLRDDLGNTPDATPLNYENAFTRGITPGEYVVNVHCYRCPVLPQKVQVEVSVKDVTNEKVPIKIIATTEVELLRDGEELTALRFRLTDKGELVPGSMNHLFVPLRGIENTGPPPSEIP